MSHNKLRVCRIERYVCVLALVGVILSACGSSNDHVEETNADTDQGSTADTANQDSTTGTSDLGRVSFDLKVSIEKATEDVLFGLTATYPKCFIFPEFAKLFEVETGVPDCDITFKAVESGNGSNVGFDLTLATTPQATQLSGKLEYGSIHLNILNVVQDNAGIFADDTLEAAGLSNKLDDLKSVTEGWEVTIDACKAEKDATSECDATIAITGDDSQPTGTAETKIPVAVSATGDVEVNTTDVDVVVSTPEAVCECSDAQYITKDCTATTDVECAECTTCQDDEYVVKDCAEDSNRMCATCTVCDAETEVEISACTETADTECQSVCNGDNADDCSCQGAEADTLCANGGVCDTDACVIASSGECTMVDVSSEYTYLRYDVYDDSKELIGFVIDQLDKWNVAIQGSGVSNCEFDTPQLAMEGLCNYVAADGQMISPCLP